MNPRLPAKNTAILLGALAAIGIANLLIDAHKEISNECASGQLRPDAKLHLDMRDLQGWMNLSLEIGGEEFFFGFPDNEDLGEGDFDVWKALSPASKEGPRGYSACVRYDESGKIVVYVK